MKRYRRKQKIKPHSEYGIYPNRTVLMARGNANLLWIWSGKEDILAGTLELQVIAHSEQAIESHKGLARRAYHDNASKNDFIPSIVFDGRPNLTPASSGRIDSMNFIHPDYIQIVSKYKTNIKKKEQDGKKNYYMQNVESASS